MKIILRQFLVINPDNNEEQRSKLDFSRLIKRFRYGELYLEQCETIPQKGFIYHGAKYSKIRIGSLNKKLTIKDYANAKKILTINK